MKIRETEEYDLEFERPLAELAEKIRVMRKEGRELENPVQLQEAVEKLRTQMQEIYTTLNVWQTLEVAQHEDRPQAMDYIHLMCEDFLDLHSNQILGEEPTLIGGPAIFNHKIVIFLGHQKGHGTRSRQFRDFGIPHPEEYRKAYRLMQMAGKFKFPVICLIDTPNSSPGLGDDEHGLLEAITANRLLMARLAVPVIAVIIGEGGGDDVLAISVVDRLLMLEHSVYTVVYLPPEAASIHQHDTISAPQVVEATPISARELLSKQIIDGLVSEPVGGAHRNAILAARYLQVALKDHLQDLKQYSPKELIRMRNRRTALLSTLDR
ncbi:MAG: acetyl-CoA carboxylase carboxyl transferase subunit alpha [Chloroflexota bacterium]|nr:acetyl-CoA carboxylase carboxyl transferase subunit alpha [Chloroflexota bacterium]